MKNLLAIIYFTLLSSVVFAQLSAGPDQVICEEESAFLGGSGGSNYKWGSIPYDPSLTTPGIANPEVSPSVTTSYYVESREVGNNFLLNGTFELGNVDFTSAYTYSPGSLWNEGTYAVVADANTVHPNFFCDDDHTSGSGLMMCVNGAAQPGVVVWSTNLVNVTPNTDYEFSTWISSLVSSSPAILQFRINGVLLGEPFQASSITCQWFQFFEIWNSGTATSAEISIVNQNTAGSGNDFALDDISYAKVTYQHDTCVVYVVPVPTSDFTASDLLCSGENAIITYTGNAPDSATYNWDFSGGAVISGIGQGPYEIHWDTPGQKQTSLTVEYSCSSTETIQFTEVYENPTIGLTADMSSIPYGTNTILHATMDGQPGPLDYNWSPGVFLVDPNVLDPTTTLLEYSTMYYFDVTDQSIQCISEDSIFIEVTGSPLAILSLEAQPDSLCVGEPTLLQADIGGGSGNYILTWTSSPDVYNYTGSELQVMVNPTSNTTYFITVDDGFNQSGPVAIDVIILHEILINQQPESLQVNSGEAAFFSVETDNATSWQWQYTEDGGTNWIDLDDDGNFSGSQTSSLVINPTEAEMSQWQFRCLMQGRCSPLTSESAILTVVVSPDIISGLYAEDVCEGEELEIICQITNFIKIVDMQLVIRFDESAMQFMGVNEIVPALEAELQASVNGGELSLSWQSSQDISIEDGQLFTLLFHALAPGLHQVDWVDEASSITNLYAVQPALTLTGTDQEILPLPVSANYAFADQDTLSITDEVDIELAVEGGSGETLYWSLSCDSTTIGEGNPFQIFRPEVSTTYYAWWTTMCGNSECVDVRVKITSNFGLYFPNAFTPNNDGLNDEFKAVSLNDVVFFQLQIFNRWGQLFFETDDAFDGWDGKFKGKDVAIGSYVWKSTFQFRTEGAGSETFTETGMVTLTR